MKFAGKKILIALSAAGILSANTVAHAAAFQLWEQDGASVGNYHAGRAASAEDASIGYYNPAGLVRIHNQQVVVGLDPILTNFKFRGTVNLQSPTGIFANKQTAVAQGGGFNLAPDLHYAAPINDMFIFGISVVAPFGLETNYGRDSFAQYAATKTSLYLFDIAPSLGIKIDDHWSVGLGLDAEHARAEFDLMTALATTPPVDPTSSENVGSSWAYGYHLGAMYQLNDASRVGLAYHSKVTHHMDGTSKYTGILGGGETKSNNLKTDITLPATTTLSGFQQINSNWDVMGTIAYTQWSELKNLVLRNVAGIPAGSLGPAVKSLIITVPENYHNTWNFSVGANYHLNDQWMFRTGVGYDQSPSSDRYRNLQLPDSDRIAVAVGTHYQATKTIGVDFGWTHIFGMNTRINNLTQPVGAQTTTTNGSVQSSADVLGLQLKWDIV